jgi:hypothetical protein
MMVVEEVRLSRRQRQEYFLEVLVLQMMPSLDIRQIFREELLFYLQKLNLMLTQIVGELPVMPPLLVKQQTIQMPRHLTLIWMAGYEQLLLLGIAFLLGILETFTILQIYRNQYKQL